MDGESSSTGGEKSKNSVGKIILIIILVLAIGGAIAYFMTKDDEEPAASTTTSQPSSSNASFEPADTSTQPYQATITSTVSGAPKTATFVSDGKGNYSYTYAANGKTLSTIYTADAYYICASSTNCIKYPTSNTQASSFDPDQYQFDGSRLQNLKNSANYKGQEACPGEGGGTCDVWEVKGEQTNTTIRMYVDTATKRIMKAVYSSGTTSNEITYEYKNAEVAVPKNFTSAPQQ